VLYHAGNSQAQAYALYGLHEIQSARFQELRDAFRAKTGTVTLRAGCSTIEVPMHDLSYVFEDHTYLLKKAEEWANLEGCVRPERSGAVNTTIVEQAPASPEVPQGRPD